MKKRIGSTLGEDTTHSWVTGILSGNAGSLQSEVLFFFLKKKMKIKCGYFLVVERTTLENLSSTSHVISRSRGVGRLLLNRRSAQRHPRVGLESLSCTASLRSNLHQL